MHGRITLASGKEADYYVDLRRITLHHRAAPLVGHVLLDHLEVNGFGPADVDAVGGLTLGADPVATSSFTPPRAVASTSTPLWCARRTRRTACSAASRVRTSRAAPSSPSRTRRRPEAPC
ncbi:hypothetical protein GCM10025876_16640 [Demequina litorisediminis]|uniref:Orotate phosphoribosyltransferase n=1 Tax=Demequina litorisediminis TaxID=1849022 RepID=A0ABQ6IDN9_9MICO|nr:hypothetical protein GCM10025876_16640 [Demequina litorisediminis]